MKNLEQDLYSNQEIIEKCKDSNYANNLYGAMCNVEWDHKGDNSCWGCSWRYAGGILADICNRNLGSNKRKYDYLDFYCCGTEGQVDECIEEDLEKMGWKYKRLGE